MRRIRQRLTFANVVSMIALFVALGGTTYAATGGNFILGQSNSASSTTSLTRTGANTAKGLQVNNNSSGAGATALGLSVASGHAPFTVNSGAKVTNLNADKLDSFNSTAFARGSKNAGTFASVLQLSVPGVGTYAINCFNGGTLGNDADDSVGSFDFTNQSGSPLLLGFSDLRNGGNVIAGTSTLPNGEATQAAGSIHGALYTDLVVTPTGTAGPAVTFSAAGQDINSSENCLGIIHAVRSG
jgi:hypothetical protein